MASLHIEHPISDLTVWSGAFGALRDKRRQAGVRRETVRQPVGDPKFIVVDLDFDTVEQAREFLGFLETRIWATPESSPALAGKPIATVLETVELS